MDSKIDKYYKLLQQEKELKQQIEKLNKEIKDWLKEIQMDKIEIDGYKVHISNIDFRKFTDDVIPFLKINGFGDIVETKEVFDYDKLKKLIKDGKINKNSINKYRSDKGKISTNLYVKKL